MSHTIKDLKNQLQSSSPPSVYLLVGDEEYFQKESLKMLIQKWLPSKDEQDFNLNVFYATENSIHQIGESLETFPVFCEKRLVICHDAHLLKEKDWNVLLPMVKNIPSSSVLIFVGQELDRRKKSSKVLLNHSYRVHNMRPKSRDLPQWVRWMASSEGVKLSPLCIDLVTKLAGPSLMSIQNELKKINILDKDSITEEDVVQVVSRVRPENVFSFTEAIGRQDVGQSLSCLVHLLEDHENEVGLLVLVTRHIRILSQLQQGIKEGLKSSDLSVKAGVPVYFLKDYMNQVQLWDENKISKMTEILYATDKALKSSPVSSHIWLENMVLKACSL